MPARPNSYPATHTWSQAARQPPITFSVVCPICALRRIKSSTPLAFSGFTNAIRATAIRHDYGQLTSPARHMASRSSKLGHSRRSRASGVRIRDSMNCLRSSASLRHAMRCHQSAEQQQGWPGPANHLGPLINCITASAQPGKREKHLSLLRQLLHTSSALPEPPAAPSFARGSPSVHDTSVTVSSARL